MLILLFVFLLLALKKPLFEDPFSPIIFDKDGHLLSARIAADGQWRFPPQDKVPEKIEKAVINFEDAYFYCHFGFNPISICKAIYSNLREGEIVRGGSTISMQLIRLSRKGQKRTYLEKLKELLLAISLEMQYSKKEILSLYVSNAPFGGNILGVDAAAWRYFGRSANDLSWAEAASLAVLPNAPSMVNVSKNRVAFKNKRDRLLLKLLDNKVIDSISYELAIAEEIPIQAQPLPDEAPHYLELLKKTNVNRLIQTSINNDWQLQTKQILSKHYKRISANYIQNMAVLVRDVNTGEVVVYHANTPKLSGAQGSYNDMIQANRSSGSILKPFLYAAALEEGLIQPNSILPDIPSWVGGYSPKNFNEKYSGAVTAGEALRQSLNVPFVLLLKNFGIEKFHRLLKDLHLSTMNKPSSHYGLSIILGGGEINLWELTEAYRKMAFYLKSDEESDFPLDKASIYLTSNVLKTLNRPQTETGWNYLNSEMQMAWKTGTSYGFRDAWAVGYTPDYVIGVWVGNADGSGRPGLTGVLCAAPILFDVAEEIITKNNWFEAPYDNLVTIRVCKHSGYLAGQFCDEKEEIVGHVSGTAAQICPFCKPYQLDENEKYRVKPNCVGAGKYHVKNYFVLPPLMARFFHGNESSKLPPLFPDCADYADVMEFVYPPNNTKIFRPKTYQALANPIIFELAHQLDDAVVYWHFDNQFVGETKCKNHKISLLPNFGRHEIVAVDQFGNRIKNVFFVVSNH